MALTYETVVVTNTNDDQWSTNLSNNVSEVQGNIIINSSAVLNLENATIHMCRISSNNYPSIIVNNNGILNINGSTITRGSTSPPCDAYHYGWKYENGSNGTVTNTTVEFCTQNDGLRIETNEIISLFNVSFYHGAISFSSYAIYLNSASNINIRNCTIDSSSSNQYTHGIYILDSNNCNIINNSINNCTDDGIYIRNSEYINLFNNTLTDHERAINISSSSNNTLRYNVMNNSTDYNLYITGNFNQDIDTTNTVNSGLVYYYNSKNNITITDNNIGHITLVNCSDLWVDSCTVHNGDSIRIIGSSSNVSITDTDIENNTMYGINLESTVKNNITSVTIKKNTKQGIYIVDSSNNTIKDSHILNNCKHGIFSEGSGSYNNIINNSIINNSAGIYLLGNGYNNFTDNNISDNRGNGVTLGTYDDHTSQYNILHNNTILLNNATGIVFHSNYNDLTDNNISENRELAFRFPGVITKYYYNYIRRGNTANGEQINYYYNENGITVESKSLVKANVSDVGKITLINCNNCNIQHNVLSNNIQHGCGMFLWNSYENDLTNNTLSNNYDGIRLYNSSNNNIIGLKKIDPSDQYGAFFESDSDHNSITDSSLTATNSNGLWISSSKHTSLKNITISSVNESGIYIIGSYYTDITNATVVTTGTDGVYMTSSDYVTFIDSSTLFTVLVVSISWLKFPVI